MGRLHAVRARVAAGVVLLIAAPLLSVLASRLVTMSGAPAVGFTVGAAVAYLLCVGPRGGALVAVAYLVEGIVVRGAAPSVGLVVVAGLQAGAAVAATLLVERRMVHHGRVRRPIVAVEYVVIVAAVLPALHHLVPALLGPAIVVGATQPPLPVGALADGIGVLLLAPGLRLLVMGERPHVDRATAIGIGAASATTFVVVLAILRYGGFEALLASQVVVLPLLLIALLVGTAAYATATAVTSLALLVLVAVTGHAAGWDMDAMSAAVWWTVFAGGLVLAADGDRRQAASVEFRSFFMRSAAPALSVNASDGRVTRANEAVAQLLGARPHDLVGRRVLELVEDQPAVAEGLEALLAGDVDEFSHESPLQASPGDLRWVRYVAVRVPIRGPQHDVLQVQFLDLTAERERTDALQRSNTSLERFGRRVTHDLKQPVAAVATYASTLREHGERMDPAVLRTMYERLEAVATRAVTQLDDTFTSAVGASGEIVPVRLDEAVASVVGVIDIDLVEAGGVVETALTVPRVRADPSVLRQVLLNLVTNSLKYARDDAPPRVRVASRVRGPGVEVTVTDNGTGIPLDALETVFERGRRLDPTRADGRGHGLADSRELAESAGGWLRAEPWADGARLVLWLPDVTVAGTAPTTRVLLVDDEPDAVLLLAHRLGLDPTIDVVGTAATIEEAVTATRELQPDVVLLDRWLREEDGLSGVVELARAHPDVRVILLTSDTSPGLDRTARSEGALRALDKTVSDADLVAQLRGTAT